MSDELPLSEHQDKDKNANSASSIFAAIMREAAEKARPKASERTRPDSETGSAATAVDETPTEGASETDSVAADKKPERVVAAKEQQRIRRINRRQLHQRDSAMGAFSGFIRTLFIVCLSTGLVATLLTFFTNPRSINPAVVQGLQLNNQNLLAGVAGPFATPTVVTTPKWHYRIGILAGHRGRDSGAVCLNNYGEVELREVDINFAVAQRVMANLKAENFAVDLLDENDPRLDNYQAAAVVSIHANTCKDFGELVTGYMIAKAEARPDHGVDAFLRECVGLNYGALVPLQRTYNLTVDMTNYHVFRAIHPLTPAVILEMGFMLADREVLTTQSDLLAHAITNGIRCFLEASEDGQNPPQGRQDAGYLVPVIATPTPLWRR